MAGPRRRRNQLALAGTAVVALTVTLLGVALSRTADAQRIDPRRPSVFVVGAPGGASPTLRGDGRRTGATKDALPTGLLRIAWRKNIGLSVDQPALAGADGTLAVVTATRGEVIFLDGDGDEKGRVTAGGTSVGLATMTSDGTVVFTTSAGDAVGIRRTSQRPRFVTRIGGERNVRAAPLSLDDGGVVIATATDLVVLDAEGNVRSRVSLPESPSSPLLAAGDKVIAIAPSGNVYGWTPGREPVRIGSFGAPIDGGAALADANTLVAVIEGNHLVDLDLTRGARTTRSITTQGLYLGPVSVRAGGASAPSGAAAPSGTAAPAAAGGTLATLLAMTPSRLFVVTIDPGGLETARAPIATLVPPTAADGGVAPLVAPAHVGPLVDLRGAVAFVTTDGKVGTVGPDGAVDTLGELICPRTPRSAGVAGLTPLGRGGLVVTCEGGGIAKITGREAESLRRSSSPSDPTPPRPPASGKPNPPEDDDER